MGRQVGALKFTGSVGDLNFYYTKNNGWLVRQKSSLSAKRFKNDPAFERARENGSNFGKASTSGKHLRLAFYDLWMKLSDSRICSRAVSMMHKIRKFDTISDRGKFQTMIGLQNPEARALLKGFSFNAGPSVANIMLCQFTADLSAGTISIPSLNPKEHLDAPRVATHVGFTSGFAKLNFSRETAAKFSEETILPLNEDISNVILAPSGTPAQQDGISILAMKIVFYQQINGELYLLSEKSHTAIEIVAAGFPEAETAALPADPLVETLELSGNSSWGNEQYNASAIGLNFTKKPVGRVGNYNQYKPFPDIHRAAPYKLGAPSHCNSWPFKLAAGRQYLYDYGEAKRVCKP